MQNERIFFAPSLIEVVKQLLIYRPTGVLTIWRASGTTQDDAKISIEQGRLLYIFWGSYREIADETILGWINSWGPIHFSFQATDSHLQLPAPGQTARQEQPPLPQSPLKRASPSRRPAVTQPLQALPAATRPSDHSSTPFSHETVIVSHTGYGRNYPPANLPRYDRTIFLLINGRRSVVDLSHLTKRSLAEVYNTLHRLKNLQLITVEAKPTQIQRS